MIEFSENQTDLIRELVQQMNQSNVRYVIPRGYRNLPNCIPGSDIDIVVQTDSFERAVSLLQNGGFSRSGSSISRLYSLLSDAIENPTRAKEIIVTNPRRLYLLLKNAVLKPETDSEIAAEYLEFKAEKDGVVIHLMNRLAYKSPHNQQKIPVDPKVDRLIHKRSMFQGEFPIPSPPDELAHLVCRGVFDYEGNFPRYYTDRCDQLVEVVFDDDNFQEQLSELLEELFFGANEVVIECLEERRYDSIKTELLKYADY